MTYRDSNPETVQPVVETVQPIVERTVQPVVERQVIEQPVIREVVADRVVSATSPVDMARRLVWLVFGILQALIVLRVVLLILGANHSNDLVSFIIGVTDPFVEPFRGMFRLDEVSGASRSILDVAAIVALIAWTLVEALVLGIIGLADRRATTA
ncbi:MAG: YggT family protein [Candidatus Limnocylindrales bacterium]